MATKIENRKVSFWFCVGNLKPTKVSIHVYDPLADRIEIQCKQYNRHGLWTASEDLPKKDLHYNYIVELAPKSEWKIVKKLKEIAFSGTPHRETRFRNLPGTIVICRDVFEPPSAIDPKPTTYPGLINYLQGLVDSLKTVNDLKRKLLELEHLSRAFEADLLRDGATGPHLRKWLESSFVSNSIFSHRLVLLSTLHGKLANRLQTSLSNMCNITAPAQKKILGALENVERSELTTWSLEHLRITALQALEATKKNHWIYAAASFPYLFELSRVLDLCTTMKEAKVEMHVLENKLIPRIQEGYSEEQFETILYNLAKSANTAKQKTELTKLIEKFSNHQKQDKESTLEVYTAGAWSATSKMGVEGDPNAKLTKMEELDIRYPSLPAPRTQDDITPSTTSKTEKEAAKAGATDETKLSETKDNDVKVCLPSTTLEDSTLTAQTAAAKAKDTKEELVAPDNKGVVSFQVLIQEENVTHVTLVLRSQASGTTYEHLMELSYPRPRAFNKNIWKIAKAQIDLPIEDEYAYHYVVTMFYSYVVTSTSYNIQDNTPRRVLPPKITYDVFQNEKSKLRFEIASQGKVVYADMILRSVSNETLKDDLMLMEEIGFPGTTRRKEYIREVVEWIQDMVLPSGYLRSQLSQPQMKFLAVLLGKIIQTGVNIDECWLRNDCIQLLIQSLRTAIPNEFPTSVSKDLTCVCTWLIGNLKFSWMYIWLYFHQLFDINILLNMKRNFSLQWSQKSWEKDQLVLKNLIVSLKEKPELVQQLIICCLDEVRDTRVLKEILLMCRAETSIKDESEITTNAVNQLNNLIKNRWKNKFQRLFEVWQDMRSANLTEMADLARMYMVTYLKEQTWLTRDKDDIEKSILCKDTYSSSTDLKEIIQNMLKQSGYPNVYENFLSIMKDPEIIICANPKIIQELLEIGIQSLALSCKTRSKKEAIRMIYKILALMKLCDHLSSSLGDLQSGVDKFAYDVLKGVTIDCLFSSLDSKKGCDLQPEELHIVADHIQRRLSEDKQNASESKSHVKLLQSSDGNLHISSGPVRDVILTLIGIQEQLMSPGSVSEDCKLSLKFESSIAKIIKDADFWIMIFKATGQFSDTIHQHPKCQTVMESLALFSTMMVSGNITINFVRQTLNKHRDIFLQLLRVALPENMRDSKKLNADIKHVFDTKNVLRKKLDDLGHFSKCLEHLVHTVQVSDAKAIIKELYDLKQVEMQGSVTLKETMEDSWWGKLLPLIPFADKLQGLSTCIIFLNICRSILEGTCAHVQISDRINEEPSDDTAEVQCEKEETDNEDDHSILTTGCQALQDVWSKKPIGTVALAHLVDEIFIPTFTYHCNILLSANLDVSVGVVENMMDGVSDMERLSDELKQIKAVFGKPVPQKMLKALKNLVELPDLTQRSCQLKSMFATFEVDEEDDDEIQSAIKQLADLQVKESLTLQQLHDALQTVSVIEKDFEVEDWDIIEQLANSQELVYFLGPLVDEDLRNLIDAVEERSEQHVSESTVSDLIDVKRYMEPLLKVEPPQQALNLIEAIKQNQHLAVEVKGLPAKIDSCVNNVHSLRDLYNNVANRGEMTKEVICNALEQGIYNFRLDDITETCNVMLTYQRGKSDQKSEASYSLNQLNDFRSRALLIVNTKKHTSDTLAEDHSPDHSGFPVPNFEEFINCINTANDIVDLCMWLRESGHFSFRWFEEKVHSLQELENLKISLKNTFDNWQAILKEAREKYYFLNFFHSKQLWMLDQFFQGKSSFSEDLALLFRFVDTSIALDEDVRDAYESPPDNRDLKARLFHLGMALMNIFHERPAVHRQIPGQIQQTKVTLDSKVQKGIVFVAELEEDSTKSIPVLLRLYSNTTGVLPEPSQIVFCHQGTLWEEIALLLQRCIGARSHFQTDTLFVLANVELLPTETQFRLVSKVKKIQESNTDFLLAMICRGGSYHHIIDQFSPNYTHCLHGFSDAEMSSCLRTGWSDVEVVTSSQPGLGKTEYIRNTASKLGLGVRTLPVSGPITKEDLVEQLKTQTGSSYDMLHIDVAQVSDPKLFDTFLFEVVVVQMAVSGTHMCLLPKTKVVLEVANTQKDKLRNALTLCTSFTRAHLEWTDFKDFIISQDINSAVQVVCQYLKALNNGTLDKSDIVLSGQNTFSPLPPGECHSLLKKFCGSIKELSFTTVSTFLEIFAQELRRMSASLYFTTRSLKDMLGNGSNDVRSKFVQALLEVSKDFTARSVESLSTETKSDTSTAAALLDYRSGSDVSASQMVARMQGMVKWADSNHLLVVFHRQDSQTISTLYRMLSKVPTNISKLFETQMKRKLPDYSYMSQIDLHDILEKVCRNTRTKFQKQKLQALEKNYALTPDNLLKMVLIHMRIKSHIPVIIMGETGCGKTTLVTYLARVCEVSFEILNLHAGISEQDIIDFVSSLQIQADKNLKQEVWGFLDEINTCDHLGILNEVICHHSLKGVPLPSNLIFIAACNPYRLRESAIVSTGLEGKHRRDEMSKLVYRVHPLPETMMDYVWDYGSLDKNDEEAYIRRMLEAKDNTFVDLVVMSQEFMRKVEQTSYCVSLRDVNRCQHLANWFIGMLKKKKVAHVEGDWYINKLETRSMILALAHCYHSRLTKAEDRQKYRQNIATILSKTKRNWEVKEGDIECMIRKEQLDILERMQLPEGIAKNEALRENVFVILISILNRIPVFVVGKPGCSKSLSMQLIRSNLRGPDSKDSYFKSLPPVYVVSYQGSESSTSEGIIKVFDKAKNYKKHNPDVMPVVLLDEIGLAEVSNFNPLKVLHSQLEPTVGGFPPVAVVGISNWALDAAKMNRAIHLSRPEPTIVDLADTAQSIRDDSAQKKNASLVHHIISDEKLCKLAEAYSDYQVDQLHTNFHGLRDYYSLVKYVAMESSKQLHGDPDQIIEKGILRNFGGLKLEMWRIMNTFTTKIGVLQHPDLRPGTMELIQDNMDDRHARHLMLITSGDSALSILEQTLEGREHVTKFGSRFENDISEEYNYTVLSDIILCMERGVTLVLRDLENIYGSLYDMLNQNYTIVGKKRNCRIALGPFSNPMCQVHQNFRCIVLVDEQKVDYQNPPFLNRFEKQTLRFSDILTDNQVETIGCLRRWMDDICCVEGFQFSQEDMFLGLHSDTLPSLVYHRSQDSDLPSDIRPSDLAYQCQQDLMKVACPDAVLRASKSKLAKQKHVEVERFQQSYFDLHLQDGLKQFFENQLNNHQQMLQLSSGAENHKEGNVQISSRSTRTVIYTHSSIHTDIRKCLEDLVSVQVEKLSKFKSERHFAAQMRQFWFEADAELLILQCITSHDAAHMLLAKSRIDQYRNEYLNAIDTMETSSILKHACIIVHIDRSEIDEVEAYPWQFNFLCGWEQFTLDTLEPNNPPLEDLLQGSVSDQLARSVDLDAIIREQLLWCFSCIKYENQTRDVDSAIKLARDIANSNEFIVSLKMQILHFIRESERKKIELAQASYGGWQVDVATNMDLLYRCSTLGGAMMEYIKQCVREPLARCVILLERLGAWSGSMHSGDVAEDTLEFWQGCFHDPAIFNISSKDIPEPRGPESCFVDCRFLELKYPFFKTFHERIESNKEWLLQHSTSSDEQTDRMSSLCEQLTDIINHMAEIQYEEYLKEHVQDYIDDLYNMFSVEHVPNMSRSMRVDIMKWVVSQLQHLLIEDVDITVTQQLANRYVIVWLHSELIAAQLQLLSIYSEVTGHGPHKLLEKIQNALDGIPDHISDDETCQTDYANKESHSSYDNLPEDDGESEAEESCSISEILEESLQNDVDEDSSADTKTNSNAEAYVDSDTNEDDSGNIDVVQKTDSNSSGGDKFEHLNDETCDEGSMHVTTMHICAEDANSDIVLKHDVKEVSNSDEVQSDEVEESDNQDNESVFPSDEPAETLLVTKVCTDVLPVKKVLQASGGFDGWQRKASSVLLLAGRVSADSNVLHFLRLCRDFVVMLSHDFSVTEDQLADLSELGKVVNDPLAEESIFKFITSTVDHFKAEEEDKSRISKLDNFLTTYFSLCLEANLDTPLLPQIIETLCTDSGELVFGSRPVLLDIIRNDIEEDKENDIPVCEKLISTGEFDEDVFPNLALIDDILSNHKVDSNLSAVCCDIIEDVAFKQLTCDKIAGVTSDDDPIWKTASDAVRLVGNRDQIQSSLQLVAAVAFIRAFMKSTAELIEASESKHFKIEGKYFVLARNLNGLLKLEEGARSENALSQVHVFLLKCLRESLSLYDLRKLCVELTDPITNLSKIKWQEGLFNSRIGYCPVSYVDFYSDAFAALSAWQIQQDKNTIAEFITEARSSPAHRLALLAAVANTFYFKKTTDGLTDVDKQQAEWLFKETDGFNSAYREVLNRILGLSDFTGVLQLSESSSQNNVEIASVIVHLLAIIVSHADNESTPSVFMSFLDQRTPVSEMALPCTGQPSSVLKMPYAETLTLYNCSCGLRILEQTGQVQASNCPTCDRTLKENAFTYQAGADKEFQRGENTGYILTDGQEKRACTESVPGISPVAYRVLDTFIHSCFLASLCSGFVSHKQMESIFPRHADNPATDLEASAFQEETATYKEESSTTDSTTGRDTMQEESPTVDSTTGGDIQDCLNSKLETNWHLLRDISQSNHSGVTTLLHHMVHACTDEIQTQVCPRSAESRAALEQAFSKIIDNEAKNVPECQLQHKQDCIMSEGIQADCLESKLDELDAVQTQDHDETEVLENDKRTLTLHRLFRKKGKASLSSFRSQFANICQTSENEYPFLQLCLSRLEIVQYIRFLPDLLKWNKLVVSRLSHIIKRDDAKRTKIDDFLANERYHPSEAAMIAASNAFSAFQKAWNHVRDGWHLLTGNKPTFGTMTAASNVTQCIVDQNERECHLRQMIATLQDVQNAFLMDTLAIVTCGYCPALNFLIKKNGIAGLQTLPLHSAGSAIIEFEWSDNLLVYHDIGTEYGQGVVINYKYTIIERELARILVLNKAFLAEGTTFSQFAYSDELFHACSAILSEIGTTILQQKLPKELKNTIEREQGRRQTFAKDMLDHLEVILVLLKKTGGDPGNSLDDYIRRWSTQLPGSFPDDLLPEPRDGIKLQHVVHLYESLEDLLVGAVVESLHDDFRKSIPKHSEDSLAQKLKPLSIEKLEECAGMIRRFIFRFLRSNTKTNTNANLTDLVVRTTGRTMDCSIVTDLLTEDLEVNNVVKILEFINKQAEQRKDAFRKKDIQQSRPRPTTRAAGNKPGRRRRGGMVGVS